MPHNPTTNDQHRVAVILGSNIDREQNIPAAVRLLAEAATVIGVSTVYETSAVGSCNQPVTSTLWCCWKLHYHRQS